MVNTYAVGGAGTLDVGSRVVEAGVAKNGNCDNYFR